MTTSMETQMLGMQEPVPGPGVDGIALVSPYQGQCVLLMNSLDVSVTDETGTFSCDAVLNPFDAARGFCRPPLSSNYDECFIESFRLARCERVDRIDDQARDYSVGELRKQCHRECGIDLGLSLEGGKASGRPIGKHLSQ
jgi:hypothetical protein